MNRRDGFTVIEILIVMVIMGILMAFTVVNLRNSQATARDEKRKTDNSIIAQNLENYYKTGSEGASYKNGQYPPTEHMSSEAAVRLTLRDIDKKVLRAPNVTESSPISLVVAADANAQTPNQNTYVYQPLKSDGTLCTTAGTDCRKFNLFYKLESSSVVQKITSKNQ